MSKSLKNCWFAWATVACLAMLGTSQAVLAQSDCGCNQPVAPQGYSLHNYGDSACGNGCGSGSFLGRLRNALSCDSKFRPGLWDGYCDERSACQTGFAGRRGHGFGGGCGETVATNDCGSPVNDCGSGGCGNSGGCNIFGGLRTKCCGLLSNLGKRQSLRLFNFPQAAGCGSGAYGLPSDCGCDVKPAAVANAGCDSGCSDGCASGCNSGGCSIFGIKHNCFRNDGHFFGCLSRHGHRHGLFAGREGGGCQLFSGLRGKFGFGAVGSGHCQNGCDMQSYAVGCGSDVAQPEAAPAEVAQ